MISGLDTSRWPLVILTTEGDPQTSDDVELLLINWESLYICAEDTSQRYKLLFDVRNTENVKFEYLKYVSSFLVSHKALTEKWMDRTAILVSNQAIRLLIKFVFMIYHPVRPFKVFDNPEEAIGWLMGADAGDTEESIS